MNGPESVFLKTGQFNKKVQKSGTALSSSRKTFSTSLNYKKLELTHLIFQI